MPLSEEDKAWLNQQFAKFATREDLERVETTLLTEFHKWASPMEGNRAS